VAQFEFLCDLCAVFFASFAVKARYLSGTPKTLTAKYAKKIRKVREEIQN